MASTETEKTGDEAQADAARWISELELSERFQKKWLTRARKINRRYEADRSADDTKRRFSMLWSNTQTIAPAVYARPPQPVVSRRFKDADPVGRLASEVLERSLSYAIDKQDLDGVLRLCALDYTLIARAQTWERYVPTHGELKTPRKPVLQVANSGQVEYEDGDGKRYTAAQVKRDGEDVYVEGEPYKPVVYEESRTDFISWEDFGFGQARTWDEVPYVWRRVYMSRLELKKRFGDEIGGKVPLDWGDTRNKTDAERELSCKAAVYEVWEKATKCVFWVSRNFNESVLDKKEDPLGLDGFFPCPRPLFGTMAPGKLNPVPDFIYYEDQSDEIDALTSRIAELQAALKVRGFYAAADGEDLNLLLAAANNVLIPVKSWQSLKEDGGVRGKIEWWPLDQVVTTMKACIELRQQLISDVYQITGVSDIQRGASDPRETYGAQQIKATFGSLRVRDRQNEMIRFARDLLRIKAEVIAEHFGVETLRMTTGLKIPTNAEKQQAQMQLQQMQLQAQGMAQQAQAQGQQPPPPPEPPPELLKMLASPSWEDVVALLRDNASRQFRIDVETDSTIEPNETAERAQTVEFLGAVGQFFSQIGPMVQSVPQSAPMFAEIIKHTVRRFRAGREVEAAIEQTLDQVANMPAGGGQQGAAPPEPPDKTPVEVAQINLQREQIKQQGEDNRAQLEAQVAQGDQALKAGDQQLKLVTLNRDPDPQVTA